MNMETLIQVFRMEEIHSKTRAKIIIKLGSALNVKYSMNITEPLVYELVQILDPNNEILSNEHYLKYYNQ